VFPYVICMFFVTCEWTCASKVDYSGGGRTSTASIGTGAQECFPMFSACFLFSVKRQVPAVSSTAVKGAQVHLMQQEEYMTVSLKKNQIVDSVGRYMCMKVQHR
jgi:hypothetical protein